jgi:hypothetical protein
MPTIKEFLPTSTDNKPSLSTSEILDGECSDEENSFIMINFDNNTDSSKNEEKLIPHADLGKNNDAEKKPSAAPEESLSPLPTKDVPVTEVETRKEQLSLPEEPLTPPSTSVPIIEEEKNIYRIVKILQQEPNTVNDKSNPLSIQIEAMPLNHELQAIPLAIEVEYPVTIKEENTIRSSPKQRAQPDRKKLDTLHITPPQKPSYSMQKVWEMSLTLFCCCPKKKNNLDAHKKNDDMAKPLNLPPTFTI